MYKIMVILRRLCYVQFIGLIGIALAQPYIPPNSTLSSLYEAAIATGGEVVECPVTPPEVIYAVCVVGEELSVYIPQWEVYEDWTFHETLNKTLLNRQTKEMMIIGVTENFIIYAVMKVEL